MGEEGPEQGRLHVRHGAGVMRGILNLAPNTTACGIPSRGAAAAPLRDLPACTDPAVPASSRPVLGYAMNLRAPRIDGVVAAAKRAGPGRGEEDFPTSIIMPRLPRTSVSSAERGGSPHSARAWDHQCHLRADGFVLRCPREVEFLFFLQR